MLKDIHRRLDDVSELLKLSKEEQELLKKPKRVSEVKLKVGKKTYLAWRSLFNNALGPGKGGIRFHPEADRDEVVMLSFLMMVKNALVELPYGGAKGAVRFDSKKVTEKQIEDIARAYAGSFYKILGENKDVPAPDMYTNGQTMAWMLDEYEKKIGSHEPAMITGKPLELGGCALRSDATARGGFIIIKQLIKGVIKSKKKLSFAVQGFGNAGSYIAQMLHNEGHRVVAVSDSAGGIYKKEGFDITRVLETKKKKGAVSFFSPDQVITNEELLELDVDVLVLAAMEDQITIKNADKVSAEYVVELANNPVSYDADKILFKKGTMVVPDVLANSGGVIVSYFEWAQNKTGNLFEREYLEELLEKRISSAWFRVMDTYMQKEKKIDLRSVAFMLAIQRVLTAERLRGNINQ